MVSECQLVFTFFFCMMTLSASWFLHSFLHGDFEYPLVFTLFLFFAQWLWVAVFTLVFALWLWVQVSFTFFFCTMTECKCVVVKAYIFHRVTIFLRVTYWLALNKFVVWIWVRRGGCDVLNRLCMIVSHHIWPAGLLYLCVDAHTCVCVCAELAFKHVMDTQ